MSNTLSSLNIFDARTVIKSAEVNSNFADLKNYAPIWHKYSLSYSDFSGATTTASATLFTIAALEAILAVYIKHNETFSGGSISSLTLDIGHALDDDAFVQLYDAFQAITSTAYAISNTPDIPSLATTTAFNVKAIAAGGLISALTQGSATIYVLKNTCPA